MTRPECDWCASKADAGVHAQWTIADFDTAYVCERHLAFAYRMFQRRSVDGQPVREIYHLWFEEARPTPGN